jgi:hypothetical protein
MGFLLVHENYANMFRSVTSTEIPKAIRIESTRFAIIYFIYIFFFNVKMNMHWNITLFFAGEMG